jgi:Trk-type K+ transport system membrane component
MKKRMPKKISAPQLVTLVFLLLILIGTGLLMLPVVTNDGQGVPFLDALFTATSAICVTGLSTFSISEQYNIGRTSDSFDLDRNWWDWLYVDSSLLLSNRKETGQFKHSNDS